MGEEGANQQFDVIIIGGGHAGIEAANSASKIVKKVLLVTMSLNKIGLAPCNPSIGGSAKGIVVCEISALGGLMDRITDEAALQTKLLNQASGPAVQSIRSQIDKIMYPKIAMRMLQQISNLTIIEDRVIELVIENGQVRGIVCRNKGFQSGGAIIIATGTFLNSLILQGKTVRRQASDQQKTTWQLSQTLLNNGVDLIRLKTGTTPRLDATTVDYQLCSRQQGTNNRGICFSFWSAKTQQKNHSCWLTYTNSKTHEIISNNYQQSPLFWKKNLGKGPRYCPSIEDKVIRFADKNRHQLFLEPESELTDSIYMQGFATSLPLEIQDKAVRSIPGLKNVRILKYGYAIEYDAIQPHELKSSLELKKIKNLFSAGQINCTSGYEEAAAQGLIAGVNAGLAATNSKLDSFVLERHEAYMGVLISDLLTKNIVEPYRLLTGLAEHRLFLRRGNAALRLYKIAFKYGLISKEKYKIVAQFQQNVFELKQIIKHATTKTNCKNINNFLIQRGLPPLRNSISFAKLLRRPSLVIAEVIQFLPQIKKYSALVYQETEIQIKYEYYLRLQARQIKTMISNSQRKIPNDFNYDCIDGLSSEAHEKLQKIKPANFSQLLLVAGVRFEDALKIKVALKIKQL